MIKLYEEKSSDFNVEKFIQRNWVFATNSDF